MAVEFVNTPADNEVGFLEETVVGEVEQGVYDQILVTGPTFAYPDNEVVANDTGDRGGMTGRRRISKGGDATFPLLFRHGSNTLLEEHSWRDDYTAEFTVTGTSDINIDPAGTHEDGSTGIVITAPASTFNDLVGGVGDGVLAYMRAWVTTDNNQAVGIKAVKADGSKLDIYNTYGAGAVASPFGAPKTGETLQSAVLRFGKILRNKRKGNPGRRALSLLVDRYMHINSGRFKTLAGWVADNWDFEVPDEGPVHATVTGNGRIWTPGSMTPQNGQAADSHFADNIPDRQMIVGGEDLENFGIFGYPNTNNPTPVPLLLGDTNITSFSFSLAGNNNVLRNILGMKGVLVRRGKFDMTGSIGYYVADDTVLADLERLGDPDNHYRAAQNLVFKDPEGYRKGLTQCRSVFGQTGGEGGGDGEETGTLAFGSEAVSTTHRTCILQEWDIFV